MNIPNVHQELWYTAQNISLVYFNIFPCLSNQSIEHLKLQIYHLQYPDHHLMYYLQKTCSNTYINCKKTTNYPS